MFSFEFLSNFTKEEQNTDFVKTWNAIGVNMEKALYELLSQEVAINSDINFFSNEMYESWLGFFLQKIRNKSCAKAVVTVTIGRNDRNAPIKIPKGTTLQCDKGHYVQREDLTLLPGNSATFLAYQGKEVTQQVKAYHDFINIDAVDIDLDTLEVIDDNGQLVPEVSYTTSWAGMEYCGSVYMKNQNGKNTFYIGNSNKTLTDKIGKKGQFYVVVVPQVLENGEVQGNTVRDTNLEMLDGSVIYRGNWILHDGTHWTCSSQNTSFMPNQIDSGFGVPQNGYYPYVSGNKLFVKIFSGANVTDPEGRSYRLTYISTDGIQGKTGENTLKYSSVLKDINGEDVEVTVVNQKSSDALNEISRGGLNMQLRKVLYSNATLASVPEYTAWFNAQPEIGSCLVYGDFEKWVVTGVNMHTGYVTIVAVRPDGTNLTASDVKALQDRVEGKKDIAFLRFLDPVRIDCYFDVRYHSCTDDNKFKELLITTIEKYFNPDSLRERNGSLFESLDLSSIIKDVGTEYSNEGLHITAYHHLFAETDGTEDLKFTVHNGEKVGDGFYVVRYPNDDDVYVDDKGEFVGTEEKLYEVYPGADDTVANICRRVNGRDIKVGQRTKGGINLNIAQKCRVEAFIPMEEDGMLMIDAYENKVVDGEVEGVPVMRTLIPQEDVDSGLYSTGSIHIVSYTEE